MQSFVVPRGKGEDEELSRADMNGRMKELYSAEGALGEDEKPCSSDRVDGVARSYLCFGRGLVWMRSLCRPDISNGPAVLAWKPTDV